MKSNEGPSRLTRRALGATIVASENAVLLTPCHPVILAPPFAALDGRASAGAPVAGDGGGAGAPSAGSARDGDGGGGGAGVPAGMARGLPALRLARLLVRFRYRSLWNGFRHGRKTRPVRLIAFLGVVMPLSYVGLFSQAFGAIVRTASPALATAALGTLAGAIALASLFAKAAGGEAALAGSPENEFLLARPLSLPALVLARSLAGALTDLFDALFLFPALVAASLAWRLGAAGWLVAAVTSIAVQVGVSAAAQALQIGIVRVLRPARRRAMGVVLSLASALTMAAIWAVGTGILRAPRPFLRALDPLAGVVLASPAGAIVRPLAALRDGGASAAALALGVTVGVTALAVALAALVARLAGMHGWEEAGASWAEAEAGARGGAVTPLSKDLRLIVRDRSRLTMLLAMPAIFIGVQIFGAVGWDWSTANVTRVAVLTFSLCGYMAMLGPLAHMQAERRAFWILRTVPVSLSRLMAAKAAAWSVILGGTSALAFLVLSAGVPGADAAARLPMGALVVGGSVVVAWLAVAVACGAADFSDDDRPGMAPGTALIFFLVAGLYNVVLVGDGDVRARGLVLFLAAVAAHWQTGMDRLADCYDPEAQADRRVRASDGALFALVLYLGQRGLEGSLATAGGPPGVPEALLPFLPMATMLLLVGVALALYLARHARGAARRGLVASLALGLAVGAAAGGLVARAGEGALRAAGDALRELLADAGLSGAALDAGARWRLGATFAGLLSGVALVEEGLYRGVIQRALEERWAGHRGGGLAAVLLAALVAVTATPALPLSLAALTSLAAGLVRYATGRTAAAWACRVSLSAAIVAAVVSRL